MTKKMKTHEECIYSKNEITEEGKKTDKY